MESQLTEGITVPDSFEAYLAAKEDIETGMARDADEILSMWMHRIHNQEAAASDPSEDEKESYDLVTAAYELYHSDSEQWRERYVRSGFDGPGIDGFIMAMVAASALLRLAELTEQANA